MFKNKYTQTAGWSVLTQLQTHNRATDKAVGLAQRLDGVWPDWLSTRLAGGQGLSGGPGIITCEWFSLLCSSQTKALENLDERGEEAPTATGVRVCFGLLLITMCQAAKPLGL